MVIFYTVFIYITSVYKPQPKTGHKLFSSEKSHSVRGAVTISPLPLTISPLPFTLWRE